MSMPATATASAEQAEPSTCENCTSKKGVQEVVAAAGGVQLGQMCRQCRKAYWRVSS